MDIFSKKYLEELIVTTIQNNSNRLSELFETKNIIYSYDTSFCNYIDNIAYYITFTGELKNFHNYIYTYEFKIYIKDEMYYSFSSFIHCNVYCDGINFDNNKNLIKECYKHNVYLVVLKRLSPLNKDGTVYKPMGVYINGINLKNRLDKIKIELDKIFINEIISLYNLNDLRYCTYI